MMEFQDIKAIIECLLFVTDKPLSLNVLQMLLEEDDRRVILQALDELKNEYDTLGRSFQLVEIAEGYQLSSRLAFAPWIRKLYKSRTTNKLSRAALETLAVIAYRQPVTKAEIEDIRGVSADGVLNALTERKFIRSVGRKEVVGRPLMYGTTREFLHYFGLKNLNDMPSLRDLQDILKEDEAGQSWMLDPSGELVARTKVTPDEIAETALCEPWQEPPSNVGAAENGGVEGAVPTAESSEASPQSAAAESPVENSAEPVVAQA
jgi:segregation and condensation protein B